MAKITHKQELFAQAIDELAVIVKRWQEYTGKQATLESTGETFSV